MEAFAGLMAELHLDHAFEADEVEVPASSSAGKKHKAAADTVHVADASLVVKQPLVGTIARVGNNVFCSGLKTGTINYLTHWEPAAVAANCSIHGGGCYYTTPLLSCNEDEIVRWLGEASCYSDAGDHMACAPSTAYTRRVRPLVG